MQQMNNKEVKNALLDIMSEIDRVCQERGIPYTLAYGSVLGAIRHGGFIPWDDDIDIFMFREDYERFYKEFPKACKEDRLKLSFYRNNSLPSAYIKIVDTSTYSVQPFCLSDYQTGLWVDIFPLDSVPEKKADKLFNRCNRLSALRYLAITEPNKGSSSAIKIVKKIICPLARLANPFNTCKKIDETAWSSSNERPSSRFVSDFISEPQRKMRLARSWLEPTRVPFEDRHFFVPSGYEKFLRSMYGDWETPPAESDREAHSDTTYRLTDKE